MFFRHYVFPAWCGSSSPRISWLASTRPCKIRSYHLSNKLIPRQPRNLLFYGSMSSSKKSLPICVLPFTIHTRQNAIEITNILRWLLGGLKHHRRRPQLRQRPARTYVSHAERTGQEYAKQTANRSRPSSQNHHQCLCCKLSLPGGAWFRCRSIRCLKINTGLVLQGIFVPNLYV